VGRGPADDAGPIGEIGAGNRGSRVGRGLGEPSFAQGERLPVWLETGGESPVRTPSAGTCTPLLPHGRVRAFGRSARQHYASKLRRSTKPPARPSSLAASRRRS